MPRLDPGMINSIGNLPDVVVLAEASVFAQSRPEDGPVVMISNGNEVQAQLAQLRRIEKAERTKSSSGAFVATVPAAFDVPADYEGVIDPGEYPIVLTPTAAYLGVDVVSLVETTFSISAVNATISIGLSGIVTITAIAGLSASVTWRFTYGGQFQIVLETKITVVPAAAPAPAPGATSRTFPLSYASSLEYVLVGSLDCRPGSTKVTLATSYIPLGGEQELTVEATFVLGRRTTAGVWEIFGSEFATQPAVIARFAEDYGRGGYYYTYETTPGSAAFTASFVLPAGYDAVALFAKLDYPTAVAFADPALLEEL